MHKDSKIFVAGHRGLVGSAIVKNLRTKGYTNLILKTRKELDLLDTESVEGFFGNEKPEYVFLAAAKVGGIVANNTYRADFIYENLSIQNNIIHQSFRSGVKKLLFLGSTCIYPRDCPQPMREEYLLTGKLEYTNEPYAIAKIAGIKMCESYNLQYGTNFISVMPTNLYGPNDNFDLEKSHVLPALLRKTLLGKALEEEDWNYIRKDLNHLPVEGVTGAHTDYQILEKLRKYGIVSDKGKVSVEIWGSGNPRREFLWSEDMADACVFIMENRDFTDTFNAGTKEVRNTHINIGTGVDISIGELAELIKEKVGYSGDFTYNMSKPDGTLKKLTDVSKLTQLGWRAKTALPEGVLQLRRFYKNKLQDQSAN